MLEKAYLALGCFWGPEEHFGSLPGVVSTRVGYSGGKKANPSYEKMGGHAETLELEFDPKKITYEKILEHFFAEHCPEIIQMPRYRSIVFYANETQRQLAKKAKLEMEEKLGYSILTKIQPFQKFFPAEEYHQKYLKKIKSENSFYV